MFSRELCAARPKSMAGLRSRWPNPLLHTSVRASWLNPIEFYFSMVKGKVLAPNDLVLSLAEILLLFSPKSKQTVRACGLTPVHKRGSCPRSRRRAALILWGAKHLAPECGGCPRKKTRRNRKVMPREIVQAQNRNYRPSGLGNRLFAAPNGFA